MPDGKGRVNEAGLDFYKRLINTLNEQHITPMLTLYHWELPQQLEDEGGWLNRDTAYYFAEYAERVFREFSAEVPYWITQNEPWVASRLGYGEGVHAPGKKVEPFPDRRSPLATFPRSCDRAIARDEANRATNGHRLKP
ncbi:beta-glucosidase [Geomicrobium sp. JCM 19037]|nr:beta-glucosidase [Geomicrobium sp. JCM 19037]